MLLRRVCTAVSSGDDVPRQLAALLGREAVRIRRTDENPPRVSIIDVTMAVSGGSQHDAAKSLRRLCDQYPEVGPNWSHLKFKGPGQRQTPVTEAKGIVEVIMLLQGQQAARVRRQAAELLCRWLGGDMAIIDEVCALRGFQDQLAVQAPEDPRRLFGAAVEASSSTGTQLVTVFSTMDQRLTNQEEMLARIHERLEQDRQRVNLNVRAPKRAAPHQPHVARGIANARLLPVARFLDAKEREDPSWACARRSFAPSFSIQVQILKKKKLREEGMAAVYVEQNHRLQILYTEDDRDIMEEAWELTAAHREDLAGQQGNPQGAPALPDQSARPSVMDLLQRSGR